MPKQDEPEEHNTQGLEMLQKILRNNSMPAGANLFALPFSITKDMFHSELTGNITAWLFNQMNQLGDRRKNIEVELRVGKLKRSSSFPRETSRYYSPGIIDPRLNRNIKFVVDTTRKEFDDAIVSTPNLDSTNPPRLVETESKDKMFRRSGRRNDIRVSTISDGTVLSPIVKEKLTELYVSLPSHDLDFKIGIAVEEAVDPETLVKAGIDLEHDKPVFIREKSRSEYIFEDYQVCLTKVGVQKFEIEVELNQTRLLQLFGKVKRKNTKNNKQAAWLEFEQLVTSLINAASFITLPDTNKP